jgi:hypothetical protein
MLPNQSHAPTTATLKIHRPALEKVGSILGKLWLLEGACLTVRHQRYLEALQKFEAAHKEVSAELRDLLAEQSCCQECKETAAEWDRFEAERPDNLTALDRVIRAEREAQSEAHTWSFTPGVDEHPIACGSCDVAIHAANSTSLDSERRCG